jgi:ABC-type amino acid transport substrate-binding protein
MTLSFRLILHWIRLYTKEIGVELEIQAFAFAGIIPALTSGKVDMVAATLSRTMPRSLKILYTEPYCIDPGVSFGRKGEFKGVRELDDEKVTIAVSAGTYPEAICPKIFPKAKMMTVDVTADGIAAILAGRADAFLANLVNVQKIVQANPNLEIIPGYTYMDSFACAVRYDSIKLWTNFNMFMRMVKLDGRYAELYKKWLGAEWQPNPIEISI